ncbi:hypothetical protein ABPG75_004093 [Micractinium tetrahymenae]
MLQGGSSSIIDAAAPSPPAADSPAAVLAAAVKTQLLRCELGGGSGQAQGQPDVLWLEVVRSRGGRVEAVCNGELLQLTVGADGSIAASPAGFAPRLGDAWVKAVPGLADSLKRIRQQQAADGSLPSQLLTARGVAALHPRATLTQFCTAVAAAPGPWCDGTGPGDAPLSDEEQALLTAGELAAFLAGARGVCLLQLHKGWGNVGGARQPLLRPWVLPLLQQAAGHKGATLLASAAPGAPQLGSSLVLCARQQPFLAWGRHLAAAGVQSSIVADSPFYKLLIGRILGYKEQNVYHHIESTGGRVTSEVLQAVDAELAGLSSVPPALPWSSSGSRKR